jgi:hypothetical protein
MNLCLRNGRCDRGSDCTGSQMQEFAAGKLHRFLPSWGVPVIIENIPYAGGGVASASFWR